ncbi:MAG: hypothetical protein ACM3QU_07885 [Verrucomicrobiota bacterium]
MSDALPADVQIGPIRFTGLRWAATAAAADLRPRPGGRWRVWKAAPVVDAGPAVSVVVVPADRPHLRLSWAGGSGWAVTFRPCAAGTRAFSYSGTVGMHTAFAGGFLVDGPGCRHVQVWVQGRARPLGQTLSFGRRRCR